MPSVKTWQQTQLFYESTVNFSCKSIRKISECIRMKFRGCFCFNHCMFSSLDKLLSTFYSSSSVITTHWIPLLTLPYFWNVTLGEFNITRNDFEHIFIHVCVFMFFLISWGLDNVLLTIISREEWYRVLKFWISTTVKRSCWLEEILPADCGNKAYYNPCASFPSVTVFIPLSSCRNSLVFVHLRRPLFCAFLSFDKDFRRRKEKKERTDYRIPLAVSLMFNIITHILCSVSYTFPEVMKENLFNNQ